MDFYDYLRSQFNDLTSAKVWAHRWANEFDQTLPEWGECSSRAMAAHISNALDGMKNDPSIGLTSYMDTVHGPEIVQAMWGTP